MSTTNLLDAIRAAKENERIASEHYANAAKNKNFSTGKELFMQLSEFEKYHYNRIAALEKSLEKKGDYINYKGKAFPLPPKFEIKAAQEPNQKSVIQIISEAIELERWMQNAYADLAAQITDPKGHKMFSKLSEEEHKHFIILLEAKWSLNNFGVWKGPRP
jgi:rubrerythrin